MFMLVSVITIIIADTLFRPHLTIMSSTIYMHRSVHKKNPIKIKLKFAKCWKAQLTGMRKRAGKKEYKEQDRDDGGRMVKR
jgi:hypothetical protein